MCSALGTHNPLPGSGSQRGLQGLQVADGEVIRCHTPGKRRQFLKEKIWVGERPRNAKLYQHSASEAQPCGLFPNGDGNCQSRTGGSQVRGNSKQVEVHTEAFAPVVQGLGFPSNMWKPEQCKAQPRSSQSAWGCTKCPKGFG